jgi:hypothetical protein
MLVLSKICLSRKKIIFLVDGSKTCFDFETTLKRLKKYRQILDAETPQCEPSIHREDL